MLREDPAKARRGRPPRRPSVPWPGEPGARAARRRRGPRRRDRRRRDAPGRCSTGWTAWRPRLHANGLDARRHHPPAPGRPGQRGPWRARRRPDAAATRARRRVLPRHHPPAVARGARRAGPCARRRPARPRPRPRRPGRPARLAVLVRQPRPAEHARRPRPRPRHAGARARPRARRSRPGLRVVRARPHPGRAASRPSARRPTSRWPSDLTELRVLQGEQPGPRHARGTPDRGAAWPGAPAPVVRRGRGRGHRARRPRPAAVGPRRRTTPPWSPTSSSATGSPRWSARRTARPWSTSGRWTRCATGSTGSPPT